MKYEDERGFTLIELIVTISIMGVMLILALPQVSKLQQANKDKKYDAYYASIERGAKLYIDTYAKDLFGNNNSGCVTILYSKLKEQNLAKDFGSSNITCSNDSETYVEVRKVNSEYLYSTAMVCRDEKDKVVYQKSIKDDFTCENVQDEEGPKVVAEPGSHDWVQTKNLKVKIKVSDPSTLNKNIGIIYYWTDLNGKKVSGDYKYNYKNKKGVQTVSYLIPTKNIPTPSGQYKLVVKPWESSSTSGIQDALGNKTLIEQSFGPYKIDNVKPTCGTVTGAKTTWTNKDFTITQECNDDASGCEKNPYSKTFTATTVKYTFNIADHAGNTNTCEVDVYLDKTNPTNPDNGKIGDVSGSNPNASIKTPVSGSTDAHSGFNRYLYMVTNSSTKPDKFDSRFTTSLAFTRSCGTSYYGWAVAEDKVGNRSEVVSLGNTKDNPNRYSDWGSCSKKCGGGKQSRTNSCALVTSDLVRNCNTMDCCSSVNYKQSTTCSVQCGGGHYKRYAYSKYTGERCSKQDEDGPACNTQSCLPKNNCNIRGNTCRTAGFNWTCSGNGGSKHTRSYFYQIYCTDSNGNIYMQAAGAGDLACGAAPYTENEGWTIIDDSSVGNYTRKNGLQHVRKTTGCSTNGNSAAKKVGKINVDPNR